jgi:hypothetical protein
MYAVSNQGLEKDKREHLESVTIVGGKVKYIASAGKNFDRGESTIFAGAFLLLLPL